MTTLLIEPLRGRLAWLVHTDGEIVRRGLSADLPSLRHVIDGEPGAEPPVEGLPIDQAYVAREGLTPEQEELCALYGWEAVAIDERPGDPAHWAAIVPAIARR